MIPLSQRQAKQEPLKDGRSDNCITFHGGGMTQMEDCANMGTEPTKWACVDLDDFHVECGISADFQRRCWRRRTCHAMLSLRSSCARPRHTPLRHMGGDLEMALEAFTEVNLQSSSWTIHPSWLWLCSGHHGLMWSFWALVAYTTMKIWPSNTGFWAYMHGYIIIYIHTIKAYQGNKKNTIWTQVLMIRLPNKEF